MFSTLRRRFILSHMIPLLVVVPLMGTALIYVLEDRIVLPDLSAELTVQAGLVAEMARDQPGVWSDSALARALVARAGKPITARLMLLGPDGRLLASSDPGDAGRLGQLLEIRGLSQALAGEPFVQRVRSASMGADISDALIPQIGPGQRVVGIVRLSYPLTSVQERFRLLRYLVVGVLVAGLVLGAIVGAALAVDLGRPLQRTTEAVGRLAVGDSSIALPEQGPYEIRSLEHSFNTLSERLHSLEEARSRLLANLVHELGRPPGSNALSGASPGWRSGSGSDAATGAIRRDGGADPAPAVPPGRPGTTP